MSTGWRGKTFDRGTEYGILWARVTRKPLPAQAVMHKDMVPRMVKAFAKRGRDLTVTGFHDCGDECHRRDHPAEELSVDVVVT